MAYFPSTTGQGQGFAQVVKQNEQAIGDIENQYLKQERERQEAEAKRNSLMRKMGYLGNNLDGAYKAAFKQRYDELYNQAKTGQLSAQDAVDILDMDAKDLKSSQDQFINYAKQDHSKDISWDKDLVSNPDVYLGDMAFGQEVYEDPFKTIQAINSGMARTERRPDTLSEQFRKKVVPLLKQSENVFTQEELDTKSDDELMTILRTTNRQVPQEILNQIEQGFVNDPEVQREVIIGNGMYKVTPDGVSIEDEANVDAFASDFFKRMTSPRVQVIEQEKRKPKSGGLNFNFGGGRGENERFYFEYQDKTKDLPIDPLKENSGTQLVGDRVISIEAKGTNPYQDFRTGEGQEVMRAALVSIKLDENGEPINLILTDEEEVPYKENAFILDQEYGLTKENIKALYNQQQAANKGQGDVYIYNGEEYTIDELKQNYGDDFNPEEYEGFTKK